MSDVQDPHELRTLLAGALEGLVHGDVEPWLAMFTPDGAMEFPFRMGEPARVQGSAALGEYFSGFSANLRIASFSEPQFHFTADPDVVIVEMECRGTALRTGKPYNQRYISVITMLDGRIVNYKDYWNPLVSQIAMTPDA